MQPRKLTSSLEPSAFRSLGATPMRREAARQRPRNGLRHRQRATADESRRQQRLPGFSDVLMARRKGPAGVEERGTGAIGLSRNLGDLVVSDAVGDDRVGTAEQRKRCGAGRTARSRSSQ